MHCHLEYILRYIHLQYCNYFTHIPIGQLFFKYTSSLHLFPKAEEKAQDEMTIIMCTSCGNGTLQGMLKKLIAQIAIMTEEKKIMKFTAFNDGLQRLINTT